MYQSGSKKNKSAGRLIGELSRAALIYFNHQFKAYSIGHAQIRTLLYIAENEGLTPKEIAGQLVLDKSSITSQLKILEGNSYIVRKRDSRDARMQQVFITQKTKNVLEPIRKILGSWSATLLDGFNEKEQEQLFIFLEKMRENAQKQLEGLKNKAEE